jgi:ribosome-associated protein
MILSESSQLSQTNLTAPQTPSRSSTDLSSYSDLLESLEQQHAQAIITLDVHALTTLADTFIICTANSTRHSRAIAEALIKQFKNKGLKPLGIEGLETAEWILIAIKEVIIHIMLASERTRYQLEKLWHLP